MIYYILANVVILAVSYIVTVRQRKQTAKLNEQLAVANTEVQVAQRQLKQTQDLMQKLSNRDPVTGLLVPHVIEERFCIFAKQSRRHQFILGLILVRIYPAAPFSQRFGDEALEDLRRTVAKRLISVTRDTDTVGVRENNDYVILLPQLPSQTGIDSVVNKLFAAVCDRWEVPNSGETFYPRVMFGVASCPEDGMEWQQTLRAAERSLIRNKVDDELDVWKSLPLPLDVRHALNTLELQWPVTLESVKQRYKEAMKEAHPDRNGGSRLAEERAKEINSSFATVRAHLELDRD